MKWTSWPACFILLLPGLGYATGNGFMPGYIENKGQVVDQYHQLNTRVKYLFLGNGLNIQLKANSFSYDVYTTQTFSAALPPSAQSIPEKWKPTADSCVYRFHRIDITFDNANPHPLIRAENPLPSELNYYNVTAMPAGVTGVRMFNKITYCNLYPYIDLEFMVEEKTGLPKYNFIVHPGGDFKRIRWTYAGCPPATLVNNTIHLQHAFGNLDETIPLSLNTTTGEKLDIRFAMSDDLTFGYSGKVKARALLIDPMPQPVWSTYFGGNKRDGASSVFADQAGNSIVAGNTLSATNIATSGAYQSTYMGGLFGDIYVCKYNPLGGLVWSTYIGGDKTDSPGCIKTDSDGNIILSGTTCSSSNMATPGAYQTFNNGAPGYNGYYGDAFLMKLSKTGSIIWGTYFGGDGTDMGIDLALDGNGNIVMAGITQSVGNIATAGAHQTSIGGLSKWDGFVAKFDSVGYLQWATYYGGAEHDYFYSVATDSAGYIYTGGHTNSANNIATAGAYQPAFAGYFDVLLVKFKPDGSRLWATYYGQDDYEDGIDMTLDLNSNVYVTGRTLSVKGMGTAGAWQDSMGGVSDAYLAKFTGSGQLLWSTYMGGEDADGGNSVITDASGYVYAVGNTQSLTGISDSSSFQKTRGDSSDIMLFKFDKNGKKEWSSYFGGDGSDRVACIHTSGTSGFVHVAGSTSSFSGVASPNASQKFFGGYDSDALLLKMPIGCPETPLLVTPAAKQFCEGYSILLYCTHAGWENYQWLKNGNPVSNATDTFFSPATSGIYSLSASLANGCNAVSQQIPIVVWPRPLVNLNIQNDTAFCASQAVLALASASEPCSFHWFQNTNALVNDTMAALQIDETGSYFVVAVNSKGCTDTSVFFHAQVNPVPTAQVNYSGNLSFCYGQALGLYAGTGSNMKYQWYKNGSPLAGEINQNYAARSTGNYQVALTSDSGCTALSSPPVAVQVLPLPPAATLPHTKAGFCKNDSLLVQANTGAGISYQWMKDGSPIAGATTAALYVSQPGNYYVSEQSANGCRDSSSALSVSAFELPAAQTIQGNLSPKFLQSYLYEVTPQPGFSYQWTAHKGNVGNGQNSYAAEISWWGQQKGRAEVLITDTNGCSVRSVAEVTIAYNPFDYFSYFSIYPNPVTDTLTVLSSESLDGASFVLYDMAGRRVWNGSFTGNYNRYGLLTNTIQSGSYVLLVNRNGKIYRHRMIKI